MFKKRSVIILVLVSLLLIMIPTPLQEKQISNSTNKRILFIHHSTGGNLIKEGNVRSEIKKINSEIEFWDHNYNLFPIFTHLLANNTHLKGLNDNNGEITGIDYKITVSNNSPREYADIFSRDPNDPTLKEILKYDVIAFKNCYPTTRIISDAQLQEDMDYYTSIRDSLGKYKDKKFVLLTPPPARKETTNLENAHRAKKLVSWLTSNEFLKSTTNIYVFDFFGLLADENGFLRSSYTRPMFFDSHPNLKANQSVSPIFAKFLVDVANK